MKVGEVQKLTATVLPDDATHKQVKWPPGGTYVGLYYDEACTQAVPDGESVDTLVVYAKAEHFKDSAVDIDCQSADNDGASARCTITLEKGDSFVAEAPQGKQLAYAGKAQAFAEAGEAEGGELQHSLDGETHAPEVPTATDAGEYTV